MNIEGHWGLLGRVVGLLTISAALAGCGGSGNADSASGAPATSGGLASTSPTVSGSPAATAVANTKYSFLPTSSHAAGTSLLFSIQNKPAWARFGTLTGQLSGTPTVSDAGEYPDITITATDGLTFAGLPGFSIRVTPTPEPAPVSSSSSSSGTTVAGGSSSSSSSGAAPVSASDSVTLSWAAPTENTDGSALTNLAGYDIYYGTSASAMTQKITINTVGMLTYVISNLASGTWYFEVIAVNSAGVDSGPSSTVSTTI
jgi:hypothetical protein